MSKYAALCGLILILCSTAMAGSFVTLADETRVPLADGWMLTGDSAEYPFQIVNADSSAELLIFKSIIAADEAVQSEQELKLSVDEVIADVILSLPEAELLTNTGYFDQNRVWFALDFLSFDEDREISLLHRLKGVLYQHPDGSQLLFSLWGKVPQVGGTSAMNQIRFMQEEFAYRGDAEQQIFGSSTSYDWYLIGFLFALLIVMLFVLKRRQQRLLPMFTEKANFWRCSCGRLNHNEYESCRRCGRDRTAEPVT